MLIVMNEVERKEYFKEYYLKSKNKDNTKIIKNKRKRGRPKNIVPPFKITIFDEPITIVW